MKRLLIIPLLLFSALAKAQGGLTMTGSITASSSGCATVGSCVNLTLQTTNQGVPQASATVVLSGTWSATAQFELSADNGNTWVAASGIPQPTGAAATSATANGTWLFTVSAYTNFRIRASAFSSGPISVNIQTSTGGASGGGGPGIGTQFAVPYWTTSTTLGSTATVPSTNGLYYTGYNVNGGLSLAPIISQIGGYTTRAVAGVSDTVLYSDCGGTVGYSSSSAVAVTLPTATTLGNSTCGISFFQTGTGVVTITPTTWAINFNGSTVSSLALRQGETAFFYVDAAGGVWDVWTRDPLVTAGSGVTLTPAANGLTVAAGAGTLMSKMVCDGVTDDRANAQSYFTGATAGTQFVIPNSTTGCYIKIAQQAISTVQVTTNVATVTMAAAVNAAFVAGGLMTITGATGADVIFNGTWVLTCAGSGACSGTQVQFALTTANIGPDSPTAAQGAVGLWLTANDIGLSCQTGAVNIWSATGASQGPCGLMASPVSGGSQGAVSGQGYLLATNTTTGPYIRGVDGFDNEGSGANQLTSNGYARKAMGGLLIQASQDYTLDTVNMMGFTCMGNPGEVGCGAGITLDGTAPNGTGCAPAGSCSASTSTYVQYSTIVNSSLLNNRYPLTTRNRASDFKLLGGIFNCQIPGAQLIIPNSIGMDLGYVYGKNYYSGANAQNQGGGNWIYGGAVSLCQWGYALSNTSNNTIMGKAEVPTALAAYPDTVGVAVTSTNNSAASASRINKVEAHVVAANSGIYEDANSQNQNFTLYEQSNCSGTGGITTNCSGQVSTVGAIGSVNGSGASSGGSGWAVGDWFSMSLSGAAGCGTPTAPAPLGQVVTISAGAVATFRIYTRGAGYSACTSGNYVATTALGSSTGTGLTINLTAVASAGTNIGITTTPCTATCVNGGDISITGSMLQDSGATNDIIAALPTLDANSSTVNSQLGPNPMSVAGGGTGLATLTVNAPLVGNAASAVLSQKNTIVLNTAGALPATPVANTRYLLTDTSANYTAAAAVTVSNPGVNFECGSKGVVVQRTGTTDLFDVTGDNFAFHGCTVDGNSQSAAGTGPLFAIGNTTTYTVTAPGCTNAGPAVCTLTSVTGLVNGMHVNMTGIAAPQASLNGLWAITSVNSPSNTITLVGSTAPGGAWASGGTALIQPQHTRIYDNTLQNVGTTNAVTGTIFISSGNRFEISGNHAIGTTSDVFIFGSAAPVSSQILNGLIAWNYVDHCNPSAANSACIWIKDSQGTLAASEMFLGNRLENNTVYIDGTGSNTNYGFIMQSANVGTVSVPATSRDNWMVKNGCYFITAAPAGCFKEYSFTDSHFVSNLADDANVGIAGAAMISNGDMYHSEVTGNTIREQQSTAGMITTDDSNTTFTGNSVFGVATNGGIGYGMEWIAQSGTLSDDVISNNTVYITATKAAGCYLIQLGNFAFPVTNNTVTGNNCTGDGTANQKGFVLLDKGDSNAHAGALMGGQLIQDNTFDNIMGGSSCVLSATDTLKCGAITVATGTSAVAGATFTINGVKIQGNNFVEPAAGNAMNGVVVVTAANTGTGSPTSTINGVKIQGLNFFNQNAGTVFVTETLGTNGTINNTTVRYTDWQGTSPTTQYTFAGTGFRAITHEVFNTCTLGSTCAVTLAGQDVFTSATTFMCNARDTTTPGNAVFVAQASGTSVTFTGTGTDGVAYRCGGY